MSRLMWVNVGHCKVWFVDVSETDLLVEVIGVAAPEHAEHNNIMRLCG